MPPIAGMPAASEPIAVHLGVFWKVRRLETSAGGLPAINRLYLASI